MHTKVNEAGVHVCIYLRTASVVLTPNQDLVTLRETERMMVRTGRDREVKSFTGKSEA